jgi:hypothetical protein
MTNAGTSEGQAPVEWKLAWKRQGIFNAQYLHIHTHNGGGIIPYPRSADGAFAQTDHKPFRKIISVLCAICDAGGYDISRNT